jgi:hypothetical protein
MEVTSVAPAATPTRIGVRIHVRCRIDRIFFLNDHRRPLYNDRPANHHGLGNDGSALLYYNRPVLDHDRS